ncbi:MAG TPA: hypothetical protein PK151_04420 [Caldisericia bacterium]|nr:hypothetical protein [Caldisericia bacterium]
MTKYMIQEGKMVKVIEDIFNNFSIAVDLYQMRTKVSGNIKSEKLKLYDTLYKKLKESIPEFVGMEFYKGENTESSMAEFSVSISKEGSIKSEKDAIKEVEKVVNSYYRGFKFFVYAE